MTVQPSMMTPQPGNLRPHLRAEEAQHEVVLRAADLAGAQQPDEQHWLAGCIGPVPPNLPQWNTTVTPSGLSVNTVAAWSTTATFCAWLLTEHSKPLYSLLTMERLPVIRRRGPHHVAPAAHDPRPHEALLVQPIAGGLQALQGRVQRRGSLVWAAG